jgi:hypothetical protein
MRRYARACWASAVRVYAVVSEQMSDEALELYGGTCDERAELDVASPALDNSGPRRG